MSELFPIPLIEQIQCVEREISQRKRVYPRFVFNRKMSQAKADQEIARMSAVLETLMRLSDERR